MAVTEADREAARELGLSLAPPTPAEGARMRAIWVPEQAPAEQARAS